MKVLNGEVSVLIFLIMYSQYFSERISKIMPQLQKMYDEWNQAMSNFSV